jgi:hypothetical protein
MGLAQLAICVLVNFAFATCGWKLWVPERNWGIPLQLENGLWPQLDPALLGGLSPNRSVATRYHQRNQEEPQSVHAPSGYGGIAPVLYRISKRVAEFYQNAYECNEKAQQATDPGDREFFLDMERRWLSLAHHTQLTERLTRIAQDIARRYKE